MSADLSGGIEPSIDEILEDLPDTSVAREGVSVWMWDDDGVWGLPRMGVEALRTGGETSHSVMLSLAFPDGQVWSVRTNAERMPVLDRLGRPRVLGAGPLRFECLEPFARWRVSFDGVATIRQVRDQLVEVARPIDTRSDVAVDQAALRLELDSNMALPPWVLGSLEPEGHFNPGEHRVRAVVQGHGHVVARRSRDALRRRRPQNPS